MAGRSDKDAMMIVDPRFWRVVRPEPGAAGRDQLAPPLAEGHTRRENAASCTKAEIGAGPHPTVKLSYRADRCLFEVAIRPEYARAITRPGLRDREPNPMR